MYLTPPRLFWFLLCNSAVYLTPLSHHSAVYHTPLSQHSTVNHTVAKKSELSKFWIVKKSVPKEKLEQSDFCHYLKGVRYTAELPFNGVHKIHHWVAICSVWYTLEWPFCRESYTAETKFWQISPRIFGKKQNCRRIPLMGPGGAFWWKNQHTKISWHCPFKEFGNLIKT